GHQGRGLGASLLRTLITGARESGAHVMMASIEASNARSVALHERLGFELVGTACEVGTKFGRWLDLTMMRLALCARAPGTGWPQVTAGGRSRGDRAADSGGRAASGAGQPPAAPPAPVSRI